MNEVYFQGFLLILGLLTLLWLISVKLRNASIVDPFWGFGFVVLDSWYFLNQPIKTPRMYILWVLVALWGLRLTSYLLWRNWGKGEDYRYQQFRQDYGAHRYWWISFFQVFLLQGILMWVISSTLFMVNISSPNEVLQPLDFMAIGVWFIGFLFEAGGDLQLALFKRNPANKGKLLRSGFWKYTRHPNYFGDAAVWWGYGLFCLASGKPFYIGGSLFMTFLIVKVSGVTLLERSLKSAKPGYEEYIRSTSSFIPWFNFKKKSE